MVQGERNAYSNALTRTFLFSRGSVGKHAHAGLMPRKDKPSALESLCKSTLAPLAKLHYEPSKNSPRMRGAMQAEGDPQAGSVRHGSDTPTGMGGRAKRIFCISQLSATVTGHEDCIQAVKVTCRENKKDWHAENF